MIPAIMKGGRSFKGAARYYLHDKGAETTGRVAWAETVNLPTADPDKAWRMMAHTAMTQDALKEAAGVKATGRKLTAPVFSYSLSWHPSEKPTREDMAQAARETLSVLGLDGHQAMIVCHNDEPHPHVHVLVNRVNPQSGVAATLSLSKRKLSEWALDYERRRGHVFVEKRAENAEKRARGEQTFEPRVSRDQFDLKAANDNLTAEFIRAEWKRRTAELFNRERMLQRTQRAEVKAAEQFHSSERLRVIAEADAELVQRQDEVKARYKPRWADLFKRQRTERYKFERRERTPLGTIWNIAQAAHELTRGNDRQKRHVRDAAEGNAFGVLFAIVSRDQRLFALERKHTRERKELASSQGFDRRKAEKDLRARKGKALDMLKVGFLEVMKRLRGAHAAQEQALKDDWRDFSKKRDKAYGLIGDRKKRNRAKMEGIEFRKLSKEETANLPRPRVPLKDKFSGSAKMPKRDVGFIDADLWLQRAQERRRDRTPKPPGGSKK
jgi:hypothetical protein